jgi:probable DNA repair protein
MSNVFTKSFLLDALGRGELVVLPNRAAARSLRTAFDDRERAAGRLAWESPNLLTWSDWTRGLWSELAVGGCELRMLLNAAQEHSLWREIIGSSTAGKTLSSPDALAEMARSAWALAAAHLATSRIRATANTFDSRVFAGWAERFANVTAAETCVSRALLEEVLLEHARKGNLKVDGPVLIAGFQELTPARKGLLAALSAAGSTITEGTVEPEASRISSLRVSTVAATPRDELVVAARWIRSQFEDGADASARHRIAVVTANAEDERAEIESVFRELLAPELQSIAADTSAAPWEFAAGAPLPFRPMVVHAVALLHLVQGPVPIERLSALLLSPFIGADSERLAAARFDAQVLRRGPYLIPDLDLQGLLRLVRQQARSGKASDYLPGWLAPLNDLRLTKLKTSATRSYAEWAELIREILRTANWPGDRPPTAGEFATARAWDANLDLLATLDFRGSRVAFSAAVKTLEQMLHAARVDNPPAHSPVQIMSPEDAEGSVFDAVILLHATDEAWPEPGRVHPLLGWTLQRELGLPGSDPSRDSGRSRARLEALLDRSSSVLALSAAADERGPLRPSPLLKQLGLVPLAADELIEQGPLPVPIVEEIALDEVALPPLPSPELRGGAGVLKLQATCGFLAFAELRLRATAVEPCELGLDAGERGSLVHRALENFWTAMRSQAELRALSQDERSRRLDDAINAAFAKLPTSEAGWSSSYVRVQRERLHRLLSRWLDVELERGPFTVQTREQRSVISIGPLQLRVQPDRVDEVEGGVVLVDYKTGHAAHSSNWLGDRPDDPQLPLYALLTEPGKLQGLLFGRVRPGAEMEWHGLAANRSVLPLEKRQKLVDLELRREDWQSVLTKLADDFAAGDAAVNPKSFTVNCTNCAQRLLCRVDPRALAMNVVEEAEEQSDV